MSNLQYNCNNEQYKEYKVHSDNSNMSGQRATTLKKKSEKYPSPSLNHNVATFLKLVCKGIQALKVHHTQDSNLSLDEKQALKTLTNNHQITIKPSNKWGNVVIMDNKQYVQICNLILANHNWYRSIPKSVVDKFNKEFYLLVDQAYYDIIIPKSMWEFIRTSFLRVATFYDLPKVHKRIAFPIPLVGPLYRGRGVLTENLSWVVNENLGLFVMSLHTASTILFTCCKFLMGFTILTLLATIEV